MRARRREPCESHHHPPQQQQQQQQPLRLPLPGTTRFLPLSHSFIKTSATTLPRSSIQLSLVVCVSLPPALFSVRKQQHKNGGQKAATVFKKQQKTHFLPGDRETNIGAFLWAVLVPLKKKNNLIVPNRSSLLYCNTCYNTPFIIIPFWLCVSRYSSSEDSHHLFIVTTTIIRNEHKRTHTHVIHATKYT